MRRHRSRRIKLSDRDEVQELMEFTPSPKGIRRIRFLNGMIVLIIVTVILFVKVIGANHASDPTDPPPINSATVAP